MSEPAASSAALRLLGPALVVIAGTALVLLLRYHTMSDPPAYRPGATTEIVLEVDGRGYHQPWDVAALALVSACSSSLRAGLAGPPEELDEQLFLIRLTPAVDAGSHTRLRGCLNDATVDRLVGRVRELRTVTDGAT